MSTISVGGNYVVDASQALSFTADSGVPVYTINGYAQFTDNGSIQISSSAASAYVTAFADNEGSSTVFSSITIAHSASFTLSATGIGSSAYGFLNGSWSASFENDGVFSVSAAATAVGLAPWMSGGFVNTGTFTVSAADATGVSTQYAATYSNTGQIEVDGVTRAIAFNLRDAEPGDSFSNQGTITATATSGSAYGLYLGGTYSYTGLTITNSGTITAQHAIYEVSNFSPGQTPALHITNTNTGIINGDITLGVGPYANYPYARPSHDGIITNNGAINGAIHLSQNGNDFYNGVSGTQTGGIYLGAGFDTVVLGNDGETVYGATGQSQVIGGTGADTIHGGTGNDYVDGGGGDDTLDGGGGINTLSFASAGVTGVTVDLGSTAAQATGVGSVTLSNFQNLIGSAGADHLTGDAHDNVIDGGGGSDVLDGGGGTNTVSFASATTGVTVSLASQGSAQATGVGSVTLSNFQNLTGSAYSDHLTGDANNNVIDGGGGGNDVLDGGGGIDTVSFASQTAGVTISLALQGTLQSVGISAVRLTNFRNLTGSAYADHLTGDANNNVIDGGGGDDVIDGGGGTNTLSFASAASGVTVNLALQGQAQTTGAGTDTVTNFQNLIGSAFNDTLQGDAGNNVLTGGAGADTFVIMPNGGADTISDFSDADGDKIDVSRFYKYSTFAQILALAHQSNADTVIDFGGGVTVTLQNVTRDNLTALDFALTTGPITVGTGTITTDPALNVSATSGLLVSFSSYSGGTVINRGALTLTSASSATGVSTAVEPDPTAIFENDGTFSVTALSPIGVNFATTHNNGTFTVTGTTSGYSTEGASGDVVNSGSMTIQGPGLVTGVDDWNSWNPGGVFQNLSTGTFSVSSSTGSATGVILVYGHDFENAGQITVSAQTSAAGVVYAAFIGGNTVINTGTITASGASSTGISISTSYSVPSVSLINSGTITAQVAVQFGTGANLTNSGTLTGAVQLANYTNTVVNTGAIAGAVSLGNGAGDVLDSHLGTITGTITLGSGSTTAALGAENNTVALAAGTHVVDGGGGTNTVSYASAASGVHVSLALPGQAQATGLGTDTLTHFQTLIGSAYGDTLEGGGSASTTLTGGLGADTFVYGPGDGNVTVTDFSHGQSDRIDLSGLELFFKPDDVLAASGQVGSDTVIHSSAGDLTLRNVVLGSLAASDFILSAAPPVGPNVGGTPQAGNGPVTGAAGSDWLQGGSGADTLHGGGGSDYLDGGAGLNTATYDGAYRQYAVGAHGATVAGGPEGGVDFLANIQRIQFVDGYLAVSPTDTAGQVYRLYEAALGRAPDPVGLAGWTHALNGGVTLQSVANGFVTSQEFQQVYGQLSDRDFVTLLYHNVLHRPPDEGGLTGWMGALAQGVSRAQVLVGFSDSPENISDLAAPVQQGLWIQDAAAAEVARLYDTTLGRLPDSGGLAGWTHALENGSATLLQVTQGFVGSQEFQQVYGALSDRDFVTLLYHNTLHRDPDQGGLDGWVAALNNGVTRAQVVLGFSESPEHIQNTSAHIDNGVWLA